LQEYHGDGKIEQLFPMAHSINNRFADKRLNPVIHAFWHWTVMRVRGICMGDFLMHTLSLNTFPQNWTHNPNDLPELQERHTDSVFKQVKIDLAANPVNYYLVGNTQGMKTETTVALYVVNIYRNTLVHLDLKTPNL
jgi:hypothetical protein